MSAVIAPDAHVSVAGFTAPASTIDALPGPRPWPIVGNSLQIDARRYHLILEQWAKRYGPLYRVRLGPQTLVVLSDYRVLGELLRRRPDQLRRSSRAASILAEMGPAGVFMAEGTQWQRQRKLVMRAFTPEVVRNFFPTIVLVTERLARYWLDAVSAGRATDVANDLKRYAVDVTSWLALGEDFDTLSTPNHPLQRDVEQVFATFGRRIAAPIPYWRYFKLPADRRLDEANRRTAQRVDELIARTRAWMAEDPQRAKRPSNVLQALLAARDEPGSEFTEDDVRGNVLTMLLAGEDTTANTIAWILY
ncbi:MAG TPA: cytochrome P450, partial [Burkholderiaceae bacterium]|nr:cytochrome P450 [Burkholderiaceae bacterium]